MLPLCSVVCYVFWCFCLVFVWSFFFRLFFVCCVGLMAVLAASLLRTTKDYRLRHHTHTPCTVLSCLPSSLRLVRLCLRYWALFRLSWLLCRLVHLFVLVCTGSGGSRRRPEPWTRLHCSELHWRVPVALPVGQPGAPVSSKDCAHRSFSPFADQRLQSRSLSGRHVSTGFLDPVLRVVMKQVCRHSRRSKPDRCQLEARYCGRNQQQSAASGC